MSFFCYEGPSHAVNESGKLDGLWTSGFASFSILLTVHHLTIFLSTKAFNAWLIGFYIFSILCFMPICICLNEFTPGSMMYHTTFSDVLSSPLYWLIVICGASWVCFPYYAYIRHTELKTHPNFSAQAQKSIVDSAGSFDRRSSGKRKYGSLRQSMTTRQSLPTKSGLLEKGDKYRSDPAEINDMGTPKSEGKLIRRHTVK